MYTPPSPPIYHGVHPTTMRCVLFHDIREQLYGIEQAFSGRSFQWSGRYVKRGLCQKKADKMYTRRSLPVLQSLQR